MVLERDAYLESAQLQIENLKAMLARLRDQRYGRSSEALDAQIEQLELALEELESFKASRPADLGLLPTPAHKPVRTALPPQLPRESITHEAPIGPGCTCPDCGGALRSMGEDVTEVLSVSRHATRWFVTCARR